MARERASPDEPEEPVSAAELVTFSAADAYVYRVPPSTTGGHYAAQWDVNKYLQEITVRVVTAGESCSVRLFDKATGEPFAECPVPNDAPLQTVVEPVIDSSRYFVLRVEDQTTTRHAFIGIGFRERSDASDFNASLHDHQQYLSRTKIAAEMQQRYAQVAEDREGSNLERSDLSLKEGQTMTLKLHSKIAGVSSESQLPWSKMPATRISLPFFATTIGNGGNQGGSIERLPPVLDPPQTAGMAAGADHGHTETTLTVHNLPSPPPGTGEELTKTTLSCSKSTSAVAALGSKSEALDIESNVISIAGSSSPDDAFGDFVQ